MGEVYPNAGFSQGSEDFLIDSGGVRVVWSVSGRNRRFIGTKGLLRKQVKGFWKIHCSIPLAQSLWILSSGFGRRISACGQLVPKEVVTMSINDNKSNANQFAHTNDDFSKDEA